MPPKQNIPNVIGVPDNDDLRIMFNQIGTAIDNANANIGLLATQNQNLIQALAPHVADIANAVQNPVGLAGIEASLRHSSRPTLGPYTPERPHQWTATSLDLIRYWDENLYLLLTGSLSNRTIANANAVPARHDMPNSVAARLRSRCTACRPRRRSCFGPITVPQHECKETNPLT